jgi:nitroreductase
MSSEKFSKENMMRMEPEVLRAIIRERVHHTIETVVYRALRGEMVIRPDFGRVPKQLFEVWKERKLPTDSPDLQWAEQLLKILDDLKQGRKPVLKTQLPRPFSKEEMKTLETTLFNRRSIRVFKKDAVPSSMIKKIIEAGQWAPQACNLQTIRVIVVDDQEGLALFRKGEVGGGTVYLVICQDYRPYEFYKDHVPEYNRGYDVGAAVQNMLLMAHALGIGAVWLTFSGGLEKQVRAHYKIPGHMNISTYIALGWPAEGAIPPGRMRVEEVIIPK